MEIDWNSLIATWYNWLGSLNAALSEPIRSLSDGLGVPLVSAFLFGLLGTTAPCQISTNFGALAFLARRPSERAATVRATLAYVAAKVLVYTVIGLIVLTIGRGVLNAVGPYIDWPRKLVGPLMILLGLALAGAIRIRLQLGQRVSSRIEQRATAGGRTGAQRIRQSPGVTALAQTALSSAGARTSRSPQSSTTYTATGINTGPPRVQVESTPSPNAPALDTFGKGGTVASLGERTAVCGLASCWAQGSA